MITLNQAVQRIKEKAESHGQIRTFFFGDVVDFLSGENMEYPAMVCEIQQGGSISKSTNKSDIAFNFYFVDLENNAEKSIENELEVWSDQLLIAGDILSLLSDQRTYKDWRVGDGGSLTFHKEKFSDYVAGVSVSVTIELPYLSNPCQSPTNG